MLQILQNLMNGKLEAAEVPAPGVRPGHLLVRARHSLISAGTERMMVDFARANLLDKARQQPEKVKQVMDKIRTDGLLPTLDAVKNRLDVPMPLGYCSAGVVLETGAAVDSFAPGDLVATNGPHAEVACVPAHLAAKIPVGVPTQDAAATVLGSIALHGVRLLEPTLGETFVVMGLGLVGQLAAQLLSATGCRVLGTDLLDSRLELARGFGARTMKPATMQALVDFVAFETGGRMADGVLIAASTQSNLPIEQAAAICRKRGRIILVGVVGLELQRTQFYEKEIRFQVSCSYGPGRYDPAYEAGGHDYPLPYVRWTEQRNFEAVLGLMAAGRLKVAPLITRTYKLSEAVGAYDALAGSSEALGILLEYSGAAEQPPIGRTVEVKPPAVEASATAGSIGLVGAGRFTRSTLLPALVRSGARLRAVASQSGASSASAARQFGIEKATTDWKSLLVDPAIDTLVVATPHHLHASMVAQALSAGKHVFVEKPLAIDFEGLAEVKEALEEAFQPRQVMVGFNRRFAPQVVRMRELLANRRGPAAIIATVNAGAVPRDHWTQDPRVGGGRIIGEGCHWLDLLAHLTSSRWAAVFAVAVGNSPDGLREDKMTVQVAFEDGSIGTLHYFANGEKSFPKERIEVFWDGRILALDNFRMLRGHGVPGFTKMGLWRQDKGHTAELAAFVRSVREGGAPLVEFGELVDSTLVSLAAVESARSGKQVLRTEMLARLRQLRRS